MLLIEYIVQRVINSSNAYGYPSCFLSLWNVCCMLNFYTFVLARSVDRTKDQRTSYGAKNKCSWVQWIRTYLDRNCLSCEKNWTPTPSTSGSYGTQAGRQNMAGLQNLQNPLQVKIF